MSPYRTTWQHTLYRTRTNTTEHLQSIATIFRRKGVIIKQTSHECWIDPVFSSRRKLNCLQVHACRYIIIILYLLQQKIITWTLILRTITLKTCNNSQIKNHSRIATSEFFNFNDLLIHFVVIHYRSQFHANTISILLIYIRRELIET